LLRRFLSGNTDRTVAARLYAEAVAAARRPMLYEAMGAPDTVDGRYDLLVVHLHLLLRRLRGEGDRAARISQALMDGFVTDMDANLREMGVGDLAVAKRVHHTLGGFFGRAKAYDAALDTGDAAALAAVVDRNVFGSVAVDASGASAIANHMLAIGRALAAMPVEAMFEPDFAYPVPALS
jgi:cytochrome b pre-mRNA-processing protein 3